MTSASAPARDQGLRTFEDRYSTADQPFATWALAQLDLSSVTTAADVGCGPGRFTLPLARTLASRAAGDPSVEVVAVDPDPWSIEELTLAAARESLPVRAVAGDARDRSGIPADSCDVVMLNLVLHLLHRRDVASCLDNARTWLRPQGTLFIAGYGSRHMREPFGWLRSALTQLGRPADETQELADRSRLSLARRGFRLDDGVRELAPSFLEVEYRGFEDDLVAPADELAELVLPGLMQSRLLTTEIGVEPRRLQDAMLAVMHAAADDGTLRVGTDLGLLMARNPRHAPGR